ncbi:phosphatidylglycerophosphatase [Roseibium polysiphoniae]|uniref:Phosphatidylglycerophosphatase n=1 Tax=Roseibium polysiphoniae TaxID=2571221 RepID=A0ABR9C6K4_9HYPH|nr:phosphatidylglycerophosphatase [Roseibium polysiphoniae]MBD8875532.1 phosphatidylglycerophosphatase [Roseibium polysiphoniae]
MLTLSDTWLDLFGLAGFLNPLALIIGAGMGWRADQVSKIAIAGFAGAILSLFIETAWNFTGLPTPIPHDAGALAMLPFRFVGAAVVAGIAYFIASRRKC